MKLRWQDTVRFWWWERKAAGIGVGSILLFVIGAVPMVVQLRYFIIDSQNMAAARAELENERMKRKLCPLCPKQHNDVLDRIVSGKVSNAL